MDSNRPYAVQALRVRHHTVNADGSGIGGITLHPPLQPLPDDDPVPDPPIDHDRPPQTGLPEQKSEPGVRNILITLTFAGPCFVNPAA